jgi:hypothetical protein
MAGERVRDQADGELTIVARDGDLWKNAAENNYANRSNRISNNVACNAFLRNKNANQAAKMPTSRE